MFGKSCFVPGSVVTAKSRLLVFYFNPYLSFPVPPSLPSLLCQRCPPRLLPPPKPTFRRFATSPTAAGPPGTATATGASTTTTWLGIDPTIVTTPAAATFPRPGATARYNAMMAATAPAVIAAVAAAIIRPAVVQAAATGAAAAEAIAEAIAEAEALAPAAAAPEAAAVVASTSPIVGAGVRPKKMLFLSRISCRRWMKKRADRLTPGAAGVSCRGFP